MAFEAPVIVYNGYTLPLTVGQFKTARAGREFRFSQDFLIAADDTTNTAALFNTACTTAEIALNNADAALSVTWEGQTLYSFDPAANTGFLTRGEVIKRGDIQYDNERSRLYTFNFTCQLPASEYRTDASELGYFETNVTMMADATGRPTFVFTGEYRSEKAISAGSAYAIALYQDGTNGAKARAVTWLTANAGTWAGNSYFDYASAGGGNYELMEEVIPGLGDSSSGTITHVITPYRLVYRFRSVPELAAGTGTATYKIEALSIAFLRERSMGRWVPVPGVAGGGVVPGAAPAAQSTGGASGSAIFGGPSFVYQIGFEVAVALASASDWDNLQTVYTGSIKPFLHTHLTQVWTPPGGVWELKHESVPVRTDANRIAVTWLVSVPNPQQFIALSYSLTMITDLRNVFHKLGDGQDDTWDEHSPGAAKFLIQRATGTLMRGDKSPVEINALFPPPGGAWRPLGRAEVTVSPMTSQDTQGNEIVIVDFQVQRLYQLNTKSKAGQPGAAVITG